MDSYDFAAALAKQVGFDLYSWEEPTFLYELDHPFLFYTGDKDRCMPKEFGEKYLGKRRQNEICKKMKNARSVVIPNEGHMFPIQKILFHIFDFLK